MRRDSIKLLLVLESKVIKACLALRAWLLNGSTRVRILVKVLKISVAGELGYPRRLDLLGFNHGPVDAAEPRVTFDVIGPVNHRAEALGQIRLKQPRN